MQQIKAPQMSMTNATLNANAQGPMHHIETPAMSERLVQRKVNMKVTQSNQELKNEKLQNSYYYRSTLTLQTTEEQLDHDFIPTGCVESPQ